MREGGRGDDAGEEGKIRAGRGGAAEEGKTGGKSRLTIFQLKKIIWILQFHSNQFSILKSNFRFQAHFQNFNFNFKSRFSILIFCFKINFHNLIINLNSTYIYSNEKSIEN